MLGRRALLAAALGAPLVVRHARAADVPRYLLGVASGWPTAGGVVLWTRLTGPDLPAEVNVQWELAHDAAFTRIAARGRETARADEAHSVHAEASGLEPARAYWYRFTALGQQSPPGRTRTAPAADAAVAGLDFMIASCQRWDHGHWAAWRHAAATPPELVLFLGDYIYEYGTHAQSVRPHDGGHVRTLDDYRARYAQYKRDPALQAAHAMAPWIAVWDDHEVENDYAGLQGLNLQPDFPAQRAAAYQAWWEHMPAPRALKPVNGAVRSFGRTDWGRLARLHWIDDRQWRDPQACNPPGKGGSSVQKLDACSVLADPKRTLLGAEQERWLADGWDLQRPWNLLAQQTLMARFGRDAAWTDGWDGYPAARRRLLDVVAQKKVPGVVALGGDVHTHYVAELKADWDDEKSPAIASEFCGTSISSRSSFGEDRLQRFVAELPHIRYARGDRRGYVRFRLEPRQLQAELIGVDDVLDPDSKAGPLARFVVDAGRPGPQKA